MMRCRHSRRPFVASANPSTATQQRRGKSVSAIAAEDVSKHWTTAEGKVHAVDGITFAFDEGTLNVLLGPSGCGKSTTLRLIAGPRAGRPRRASLIGGRDVTDLPPGAAEHRDGVPVLRAVPAPLRRREHRVRPEGAQGRAGRARRAARARGRAAGPVEAARAQALAALRRPAAARGARPRDRRRDAGLPDGRAALEPRRAAAPARCAREIRALQRGSASPWSTSRTTRSRR